MSVLLARVDAAIEHTRSVCERAQKRSETDRARVLYGELAALEMVRDWIAAEQDVDASLSLAASSAGAVPATAPAPSDVDALRGLLDMMAEWPSYDQRARFLLSSNWMRDRGVAAAERVASWSLPAGVAVFQSAATPAPTPHTAGGGDDATDTAGDTSDARDGATGHDGGRSVVEPPPHLHDGTPVLGNEWALSDAGTVVGTSTTVPAPSCTCTPCTQPGYGVPGWDHCAACCAGSLIVEYDHRCPIADHRELAERQFPTPSPADRLNAIWRTAIAQHSGEDLRRVSRNIPNEAVRIVREYGVEPTPQQERMLRWAAGFEVDAAIALVELIVSGRERAS